MKFASRRCVDLIRQPTAKWANWDPPIPVKVGDYGEINIGEGGLNVRGNIYDEHFKEIPEQYQPDMDLDNHKPKMGEPEEDFVVSSIGVKRRDPKVGPELCVDVPGIANASLKGEWQFATGRRGALLVMHRPRKTYLPPREVLEHLYKVPDLQDKYPVTSVFPCPAYSTYLSDKSGEKVAVALVANGCIPSAPGSTGSGEISLDWWTQTQAGFLRKVCLSPFGRLYRDSPVPPASGDDYWVDPHQPWEPLDEDGEEDPVYDNGDVQIEFAKREATHYTVPPPFRLGGRQSRFCPEIQARSVGG
ncbi:hypothetical protein BV22DRAFT_1133514 [Leucogyrophana mollusca]|uniref:Uncharacterized protein n=1 Tax=Leucogyrophana mollusca TaxID=85980 RepID=A0ACB8B258_9AGAM|nr:hypothetical protein BV22DRAFT_1133514 [Leucogyrophana mollusca]